MTTPLLRAPVYPVPALEKGLDVLELLSARATPQSLADLARGLGRSPGEIFRMLNCLERRGFVAREDGTGRYRLTLKLYALAHTHSPVEHLLRAAEAPMRELARSLRESVHLSVLSDGKLVVLAQEESPEKRRISLEVGGEFPPIHTCSGRLLLAHLPKDDLKPLLARDPDYRALNAAGRSRLLRSLLEIRKSGVSTVDGESLEGVRDRAVLVGDPRSAMAALCVPSISRRTPARDLVAGLRQCAARITRALGLSVKT